MTTSRRQAALVLVALSLLPGCAYQTTTTEVRLRDPGMVALQVETPTGTQELLPPGRDALDVELPRTEPPYAGTALFEAHAMRQAGTGAVTLRCDACFGHPLEHVVPVGGLVQYEGAAQERVQWKDGQMLLSFTQLYLGPGRYARSNPAYRVWLATPTSNVLEVREKTTTVGTGVSLPWAIVFAVAMTSCIVAGIAAIPGHNGAPEALGIVAIDVGVLGDLLAIPMLGSSIWEAQHPSTDVVVYPR
jgi:hypothetical protein